MNRAFMARQRASFGSLVKIGLNSSAFSMAAFRRLAVKSAVFFRRYCGPVEKQAGPVPYLPQFIGRLSRRVFARFFFLWKSAHRILRCCPYRSLYNKGDKHSQGVFDKLRRGCNSSNSGSTSPCAQRNTGTAARIRQIHSLNGQTGSQMWRMDTGENC